MQIKEIVKKVVPESLLGGYHFLWAFLGAVRYGFPSKKIKVIGVTGTNGKSTTCEMILGILKEAGYKAVLSSSIRFEVAGETRKNVLNNSMPGRMVLQSLLAEGAAKGCQYAVIEVTSEGILQSRHKFIDFEAAVITNLTMEHIERHKGFENYRRAKQELFKVPSGAHIVNCDDGNVKYFLEFEAKRKICYGLEGGCAGNCEKVIGCAVMAGNEGISFMANGTEFKNGLRGKFNVYNALAAISVAMSQGIGMEVCQRALAKINSVPGRMEKISDLPQVFVDFAFTPNALEKVYMTLNESYKAKGGKLIGLLGACGGGRDKWKRPVLGEIAAKYCDEIVLTDEDPYDEDSKTIIDMVKAGVMETGFDCAHLYEIIDRREAIRKAVGLAKPGDVVVLTGKGSMPWTFLADGKRIPWNEREIALEEIKKLVLH